MCHLRVEILILSTPEYVHILIYAIYKSKKDHWGES